MQWIKTIQKWILRCFRGRKQRKSAPTILRKWYGTHCAVSRLARSTPGAIATYRITPLHGDCDYLLTLDYLPLLQAELVGQHNGTAFRLRPLDDPHNPAITHRFAIWQVYRNGVSCAVGIWDVDLQGICHSASLRELAPQRSVLAIALQILQIPHSTKTPSMSWQSQMERFNWLGLLETQIRGQLNNQYHSIKACSVVKPEPSDNSHQN